LADDQTPNPAPNDPPADPPAPAVRPEGIPDQLWSDTGFNADAFAAYRPPADDLPASVDAYQLPKIGDKDVPAEIASSPFMATLRQGAFDAGIGQEGFNGLVTKWLEADEQAAQSYFDEQDKLIGQNRETRASAIATWLDSSLPAEQAAALRSVSTNADVFKALEALMNKGAAPAPRTDVPVTKGDTLEEIQKLMSTPAYNGRRDQRDPAVVARVDKFFEEQAKKEAPRG
jgi:hypothetical protein